MKKQRPYDGRMRGEHIDLVTGPAIPLAIEHANSVEDGKLRLTTFTAWDAGGLMGLEGRSLILRLPSSASGNNRPYWGQQWFLNGKAGGEIEYTQKYIPQYVESTRCWLFDIAIQNNWFSDRPDREAVLFQRLKSLDTGHGMRWGGQRIRPPDGYLDNDSHVFMLDGAHELDVGIGKDLPVGIWYAHISGAHLIPIMERALAAPFACVCFLRFQEEHPNNRDDRTATAPYSEPAARSPQG